MPKDEYEMRYEVVDGVSYARECCSCGSDVPLREHVIDDQDVFICDICYGTYLGNICRDMRNPMHSFACGIVQALHIIRTDNKGE